MKSILLYRFSYSDNLKAYFKETIPCTDLTAVMIKSIFYTFGKSIPEYRFNYSDN